MADRIHLTEDQQQLVYAFSQETDCDLDLAYCLLDQNDWQFNATLQIYNQLFEPDLQPKQNNSGEDFMTDSSQVGAMTSAEDPIIVEDDC